MIFYVILAILFGLWFLLDQPRVFARLVSSPLSRVCRFARKDDKQGQTAQQAEPGTRADLHRKRTVGGELWSGWILKKSGHSDDAKTKGSSTNVSHQYLPVQIVRTPADAIDDPSIRRPAPAVVAQDHFVASRFLSSEEKHRLSTIEDLCEETPPMNDGDDDDNFLLPTLSHAAPIYQTHRRNDSRPNLGRIDTNVNNVNGSENRGLTRHNSFASVAESIYSQETTCVGHESLDGHEDKFMYIKKSQLLRTSPGTLPTSAISAALTSATLQGSGPASGLLSACTEAPLLSATASPRFGEGLKRMTIANEAVLHQLSYPPRIPSLFDRIPAFQKILLWVPLPSLLPRLTFLDVFVYSLYAGVVAFANFYKNTEWEWNAKKNPLGPDLLRSGAMSMAQVPLVIGLGGRNSPIRYLLGGGQSRAVINLHKFSGRACFACMLLHVGGYGMFLVASCEALVIMANTRDRPYQRLQVGQERHLRRQGQGALHHVGVDRRRRVDIHGDHLPSPGTTSTLQPFHDLAYPRACCLSTRARYACARSSSILYSWSRTLCVRTRLPRSKDQDRYSRTQSHGRRRFDSSNHPGRSIWLESGTTCHTEGSSFGASANANHICAALTM